MADETGKPGGMRRGMRLLLIGSLALNLAVLGIVGGAVIGHWRDGDTHGRDRFGSPYIWALDFHQKRTVGRAIREAYRAAEIDREAGRHAYRRAVEILRQAPFDRAALQTLMAEQDASGTARRVSAQKVLLDRLEAMSDAERAAYADRLENALKRGSRRSREDRRERD